MKRLVFDVCLGLSMLLCAVIAIVWVRSYGHGFALPFMHGGQRWEWVAEGGKLRVDNSPQLRFERQLIVRQTIEVRRLLRAYQDTMLDPAGSELRIDPRIANARVGLAASRAYTAGLRELERIRKAYVTVSISHSVSDAVPLAMTLVLPAWWAARRVRAFRRTRNGLCINCGYDLRASRRRCPECGIAVAAEADDAIAAVRA